jgi:hypothetical protein
MIGQQKPRCWSAQLLVFSDKGKYDYVYDPVTYQGGLLLSDWPDTLAFGRLRLNFVYADVAFSHPELTLVHPHTYTYHHSYAHAGSLCHLS